MRADGNIVCMNDRVIACQHTVTTIIICLSACLGMHVILFIRCLFTAFYRPILSVLAKARVRLEVISYLLFLLVMFILRLYLPS